MKKRIAVALACLGALGAYGVYWLIDPAPVKERSGTVRFIEASRLNRQTDIWGIEAERTFLGVPVGTQKLSIEGKPFYEMPPKFKEEGLKVRVRFEVIDVVGMSDWDIWIRPLEIESVRE